MKALDRAAVELWSRAHGYALDDRSLPLLRDSVELESFAIPADAGQRVGLVRGDLRAFHAEAEICVWLHDWNVWPSGQWHPLFERFRESYGITDSLERCPAMLVSGQDFEAAVSVAVYSVLMLWDCHVLGASGRPFVFYSHDEFGRKRT
jgi:hypothetical protein